MAFGTPIDLWFDHHDSVTMAFALSQAIFGQSGCEQLLADKPLQRLFASFAPGEWPMVVISGLEKPFSVHAEYP